MYYIYLTNTYDAHEEAKHEISEFEKYSLRVLFIYSSVIIPFNFHNTKHTHTDT